MPYFDWDEKKNTSLKETRNVSFEDVIIAFRENKLIDIINHPNQKRFPKQKIMFLIIHNYVYAVPYVEEPNKIFLKTIYPSRVATKKYLGK